MIRTVATVPVGAGAWIGVSLGSSYMNLGTAFRQAVSFAGTGAAILLAGQLLCPILKIVAGVGLLAVRRWSWRGVVVALGLDIVTLGVSIQRFYESRGSVSLHSPDGVVGEAVVAQSSIVPVLVVFALSLLCLVLITTAAFRRRWAHLLEAA